MFSFEAHVKLLSLFAMIIPLVFLLTLGGVRYYFYLHDNSLPGWNLFLNRDVLGPIDVLDDSNSNLGGESTDSELILAILYYCYVTTEVLLGVFLWRATSQKHNKKLFIWICLSATFTIFGFILLIPLRRHRIIEVGLAVVYTKVNSIYSIYTIIVVVCLIVKIKHRHIFNPQATEPIVRNITETLV